jgi:hypothetical protein
MKLRLKNNTVRFRTTRSEVATLISRGRLEEKIEFAEGSWEFTYAIVLNSDASAVGIQHASSTITLIVPATEARCWAQSDAVGIYAKVEGRVGPIDLILEKDFACLDRSDEDNQDTFPNPLTEATC